MSVPRSNVAGMDIQAINRKVIDQFRAGGEITGMQRDRLLLLTTTGARTGEPRTRPMMFHRSSDDRLLVMASNAGAHKTPDWYANLVANPNVRVEIANESYDATASPLTGEDYERLWAEIKAKYPFFTDHEQKAEREIPVVALTRA